MFTGGKALAATIDHQRFQSVVQWILVVIYATIVLSILPYHVPWRDEAHSWLMGRDMNPAELLGKAMAYEGTPPLRNYMTMALAKAGLPFVSLGVLNAVIAIATVAVLVFLAPFAMWQKVAAVFSIYQVFMYGMVWRLYSLAGLFMLLTAYLFRSRFQKPLLYAGCVALLSQTCLQMLGVSLLLLIEFVYTGVRFRWTGEPRPAPASPRLSRKQNGAKDRAQKHK